MGLISFIKNQYYDSKLNKAVRLLSEGNFSEAESILYSLVDKHPQAACKLAEQYFKQSSSSDVNNDISLFKKTIELKDKGVNVYDEATFKPIISNYIAHIQERARSCFQSGNYNDCVSLTSSLKETKTNSNEDSILCSEAKIRLLYKEFVNTKVTNNSFNSLLDAFEREWMFCKLKTRAKDSVLSFCQGLINSKRYYASNLLLRIILNNPFDKKCLNNAVLIIKGKDVEASLSIIKSVASTYAKSIVLRDGLSIEEATSIFADCWLSSADANVIMGVLHEVKAPLKDALVNEIINKHKTYLSSSNLFNNFVKWLYDSYNGEESLNLLEKIHDLGYNVEDYFTKKTHALISELPFEKRLSYLDHAQGLFQDSSIIIQDKLLCAQHYLDQNDNEKAIEVSESILDKCEKAKVVKALALYRLADKESDIDKMIDYLIQAQSSLSSCSDSDITPISSQINDAFVNAAKLYYGRGDIGKTYSILTGLANNGNEKAAFTITELRLKEVQADNNNEDKLSKITDAIGELQRFGISSIVENSDYQQLWDVKIKILLKNFKKLDNQLAIAHLETLANEIENAGFETSIIKKKKENVVKLLIEKKYLLARELELAKDLSAASILYKEINSLEAKKTPTLSAIRFIICKLKMQNSSDILEHREQIYTILRKAAAAYKAEKEDLAYRFALILLKSGEDQEAMSVLAEFLPDEEHLKKACEQGAIIKALAKLEDFNSKLDAVKDKTLSSDDAVYFINHMLEYADVIKPVLNISRATLIKYRNKLKNYAIYKLFDEGRYDVAFEKMVKEHKDYLDDYTILRNIALVCLNMAEANQITNLNFKEIISIWLTAIYQEKLFVKSLDYTSWDDPFTFSLYEAYGHFNEDSIGPLPDNVIIDYSDDDNIVLIKDVQRALLDRFEAAISDNQQFHEFYTSQKDAMDSFIALRLDEKCRLVAPFLAHKDERIFQEISDALELDRGRAYDNWEDVLAVGVIYQMPQAIYSDYENAKSNYENCISTMDSMNANNVKSVFSSSKVELVKRFDKLISALKSYSNSKVSALSAKNKSEFKKNYNFYLVVCSSLKDNALSFVFSNYVMQYVVGEVNNKAMKKSDAADYILSILTLDKSNSRVKENLTTLFEMLARENTTDSSSAVTNILNKTRSLDSTLYNQLNDEYEQVKIDKELNDIVDKVNKNTMSRSDALDKVYSLYCTTPENSRICENLAQLCIMCIMEYVIGQEDSSSVTRILASLNANKSSEFMKQSSQFRKAYNEIWDVLPFDTKALINGSPSALPYTSRRLSSQGFALQKGLNYFKSLGGFSTPRRSGLFGLDNYPF